MRAGVHIGPWFSGSIGGDAGYLLRAPFNAADQGFADAQVLNTPAEGVIAGQGTIVEVDGTQEIVSNELIITATAGTIEGELGGFWELLGGGGFARLAGRAFGMKYKPTTNIAADNFMFFILSPTARVPTAAQKTTDLEYSSFVQASGIDGPYSIGGRRQGFFPSDILGDEILQNDACTLYHILRGTGCFSLVKLASDTVKLLWAWPQSSVTPLFLVHSAGPGITSATDYIRGAGDLRGPWNTDYGIVTVRDTTPAALDTYTSEADAIHTLINVTLPSAGEIEYRFRQQDASNRWRVTIESTGKMDLDEVVAGVPTQRGTFSNISGGDDVNIFADDERIFIYSGESGEIKRIDYESASNFKTETACELNSLGTAGAIGEVDIWPRVISGAALTELNRVFP